MGDMDEDGDSDISDIDDHLDIVSKLQQTQHYIDIIFETFDFHVLQIV